MGAALSSEQNWPDTWTWSRVTLTVPHAEGRGRDSLAVSAARALRSQMLTRGTSVRLFVSPVPRDQCDMNRVRCRGTRFRRSVFAHVRGQPTPSLVIDVHSFSPVSGFTPEWAGFDVVVLDDNQPFSTYSKHYVAFMRANGVSIALKRGGSNDIQDEMHERNVDAFLTGAFLLEFNEGLLGTPDRLRPIAALTARWVIAIPD